MAIDSTRLPVGQKVLLPGHFDQVVTLEGVRPLGKGFECRVRLPSGTLDETVISEDEAHVLIGDNGQDLTSAIVPADAEQVRLLIESTRIRLAYTHDPYFAVSLSGIRTLPHQIEAVYMKMLPQPRLRFLLEGRRTRRRIAHRRAIVPGQTPRQLEHRHGRQGGSGGQANGTTAVALNRR